MQWRNSIAPLVIPFHSLFSPTPASTPALLARSLSFPISSHLLFQERQSCAESDLCGTTCCPSPGHCEPSTGWCFGTGGTTNPCPVEGYGLCPNQDTCCPVGDFCTKTTKKCVTCDAGLALCPDDSTCCPEGNTCDTAAKKCYDPSETAAVSSLDPTSSPSPTTEQQSSEPSESGATTATSAAATAENGGIVHGPVPGFVGFMGFIAMGLGL